MNVHTIMNVLHNLNIYELRCNDTCNLEIITAPTILLAFNVIILQTLNEPINISKRIRYGQHIRIIG